MIYQVDDIIIRNFGAQEFNGYKVIQYDSIFYLQIKITDMESFNDFISKFTSIIIVPNRFSTATQGFEGILGFTDGSDAAKVRIAFDVQDVSEFKHIQIGFKDG